VRVEEGQCPAWAEFRAWIEEVEPDFQEVLHAVTPGAKLSKDLSAPENELPGEAGRGLVWTSIADHGAEWPWWPLPALSFILFLFAACFANCFALLPCFPPGVKHSVQLSS